MTPTRKHGLVSTYRNGCRCDACRKAVVDKDRRRKARWTEAQWAEKRARDNARYHKNPGAVLAANREKRYGITTEQFQDLIREQGGACAICRRPFERTPHLDHDHETKQIRGVLCNGCNSGLGMFGDSVLRLLDAAQYLIRSRTR